MTPKEFVDRYRETLDNVNVHEGEEREQVDQARTALGLEERDLVLGATMVSIFDDGILDVSHALSYRCTYHRRRSIVLKMICVLVIQKN